MRTFAAIYAAFTIATLARFSAVVCGTEMTRIRKNWITFTSEEKALYLDAVETAMTSGNHLLFTQISMNPDGLDLVRATCGVSAWYRKWLLGYENMLRSLDSQFENVTLPYWNFFEDSAKRLSTQTTCNDVQSCSPFLQDFGGSVGSSYHGQYIIEGEQITGNCVNASVGKYACTDPSGEKCEACLPRGDWGIDSSTFELGPSAFVEVLLHANASDTPMETLRSDIQTRFHLILHNLLGGAYGTRAAAFDPIFVGHYATIDLIFHVFQRCNQSASLTGTCTANDGTTISATTSIPMVLDGQAVEDNADVSSYFTDIGTTFEDLDDTVPYEIDTYLQLLLDEFALPCTADTNSALIWGTNDNKTDETEAAETLAQALAVCADSTITGSSSTTNETAYTVLTCELIANLQNGVLTNFSSIIRSEFNVAADVLPTCINVLGGVATAEITTEWTDDCTDAIKDETSLEPSDFETTTEGFAVVTRGKDGGIKYLQATAS